MPRYLSLALLICLFSTLLSSAQEPARSTKRLDQYGDPLPDGAIARLGSTRYRTNELMIVPIAMLPDGQHLISGTPLQLQIINIETGKIAREIDLPFHKDKKYFLSAALRPDGKTIAVESRKVDISNLPDMRLGESETHLVEIETGQCIKEIQREGGAKPFAFSADNKSLLYISGECRISFFNLEKGDYQRAFDKVEAKIRTAFLSVDGSQIVTGHEPIDKIAKVIVWDTESGEKRVTLNCGDKPILAVSCSTDNKLVSAASIDSVYLWSINRPEKPTVYPLNPVKLEKFQEHATLDVMFTSEGQQLICRDGQGDVMVWKSPSDKPLAIPGKHHFARLIKNNQLLLANQSTISIFDLKDWRFIKSSGGHKGQVSGFAFGPEGKTLISYGVDGTELHWDADKLECINSVESTATTRRWMAKDHSVGVGISRVDGKMALVSFRAASKDQPKVLSDKREIPIALTDDGRFVATRSSDVGFSVYDTSTGKLSHQLLGGTSSMAIAFAKDNNTMFVGGSDQAIRQVTISAKQNVVREFVTKAENDRLDRNFVTALLVSDDGRRLVSWDIIKPVQVWEVATGELCSTFAERSGRVSGVLEQPMFSADGSHIATGCYHSKGTQFEIMNVVSGKSARKWVASDGYSIHRCAAFFPDGRRLVTGGADPLVWDISDCTLARNSQSHSPDELARLWGDLAGNSMTAYTAIGKLVLGKETVDYLRKVLKPAGASDGEKVKALIVQLDNQSSSKRDAATNELVELGLSICSQLKTALDKEVSAEVKLRINRILKQWESEVLRQDRALEVLEMLGTREARELMTELSRGDPAARLTIDTKAGLERLKRRPLP